MLFHPSLRRFFAAATPNGKRSSHKVTATLKEVVGVKNIIAVSSAKGGVGKSIVALNLAAALANHSSSPAVGILDADIFGPSLPSLLHLKETPLVDSQNMMLPVSVGSLQAMSMGFLVDEDAPVAWRGPMVMSAFDQLLRKTAWEDVDFLVLDLPPGTGDIALSLVQTVPLEGAIIVTTAQELAVIDALRGIEMFRQTRIPVLGAVHNMALSACPHCGGDLDFFGTQSPSLQDRLQVPILAEIPLHPSVNLAAQQGTPWVNMPNCPVSVRAAFTHLAEVVIGK